MDVSKGLTRRLYLDRPGLNVVFTDWEIDVLEYLDGARAYIGSGAIHTHLTRDDPRLVSRASVIFFVKDMVKAGLLLAEPCTGKGGKFEKYKLKYDLAKFYRSAQRMILTQIEEAFKDVIG